VRDTLEVPVGIGEDEAVALARASEKVAAHLPGEPRKTIVKLPKLVSFVA
jgi:hypothetical protein